MIVNLAAFEAAGSRSAAGLALPKAEEALPPKPWPLRIGKVFSDRTNFAIVDELNRAPRTPAQLRETLEIDGANAREGVLRRCKRLTKLGLAVNVGTETGGPLYGANVYQFRAASPNVSERDIVGEIPSGLRTGKSWDAFQSFVATALSALEAGTFNNRDDRHMSMSPIVVDEIGWRQVCEALRAYRETLRRLEADTRCRRGKKGRPDRRFPAAFLADSFQAPLGETPP
jgi:hypothetical protein